MVKRLILEYHCVVRIKHSRVKNGHDLLHVQCVYPYWQYARREININDSNDNYLKKPMQI